MTKQEQIAQFLDQHITLPRAAAPYAWAGHPWIPGVYPMQRARPTYEQVANELLGIAEFRALQLGTWLGTTDGQVITEAVEMVTPPFYREDVELLVEGLKLAAQLQALKSQDKAGKIALGVIGVAAVAAFALAD